MKLWICDDDVGIVMELEQGCREYVAEKKLEVEIVGMTAFPENLDNRKSLGEAASEGALPEILLLDIDMPQRTGLEIKEMLEGVEKSPYIIFVTSHHETIYEAFGKNVIGFLLKPVSKISLEKLLDKAVDYTGSDQVIILWSGEKYASYNYKEIVMADGRELETRMSLNDWENRLPQGDFFRVDKGYLVNFAHVKMVEGESVVLRSGKCLHLSRRKKTLCRDAFLKYCGRKVRYH
jgi:DNA-binding LytR/AlgR family response regulator